MSIFKNLLLLNKMRRCSLTISYSIQHFRKKSNNELYSPKKFSLCWYSIHTSTENQSNAEEVSVEKKIIYNSVINRKSFLQTLKEERHLKKNNNVDVWSSAPVSLKYVIKGDENTQESTEEVKVFESNHLVNLPYTVRAVGDDCLKGEGDEPQDDVELAPHSAEEIVSDLPASSYKKWMNDYEMYSGDDITDGDEIEEWRRKYGTPDPMVPVSQVPCGGCGALLHCQDYSIPGYIPSEIFSKCYVKDLRELVCQRCHFLKIYNTSLSVTVDQNVYPKLISKIKDTKALVVLIADMTDLPCSLWPGILDIIGYKRPLFLVGNKVDLLWGDRRGWMEHVLCSLRSSLPKPAAVKYCGLISAKTGYGVEELINKLHNIWQYKGDVYLVGCTNVGKSTLFNALLQSDYCKVKVADLIQRATTAPWPGTTLNLLKFPILRPAGWRLYLRTLRLQKDRMMLKAEQKLRKEQKAFHKLKDTSPPLLVGHIGRTFASNSQTKESQANPDNFGGMSEPERFGLNPDDPDLAASKWVYDTPGVLHKEQILDLLTTEEITITLPKTVIQPTTYLMKTGWTLFIGGLARIDYLEGNKNVRLTVFSAGLPVTITQSTEAEEVYSKLLGTGYTQVPRGPQERLAVWPGLERALEASFAGVRSQESCADVTLSSVGWISLTPERDEIVKFAFWTPKGRGVHIRSPPLLPHAVALRGKKHSKLPIYGKSKFIVS